MEPIQVLASQYLNNQSSEPSQAQIDDFYNEHGNEAFLRARHWWVVLCSALHTVRPTRPAPLRLAIFAKKS